MIFKKNKILFLIGILLLFATIAGCASDKSLSDGTGMSNGETIPTETSADEDVPDEEVEQKEYTGWIGAYLNVLEANSIDIEDVWLFQINGIGPVAIIDIFEDETPETLYVYNYEDASFFGNISYYAVPCIFLKIISYSEADGLESIFDTCIYFAAGGPNNYCVYLTREGELMLYRSGISGGSVGWGIWQIVPNQNLETTEEYWAGSYSSDLAKLYYASFLNEDRESEKIYKSNGKEISEAKYNEIAKEILEDIKYVIFPGIGEAKLYDEDLWKDTTPFEEVSMTYDEAVAWLKAQQ